MRLASRGRPTASLFVQLLALAMLTLVAAEVISLVLIFNLPPPTPDFYRLSEIVLVEATRLALDGTDIVRDGAMVEQLSAKLIDGVWKVSSPGLSMERWAMTSTSGRRA